MSTDDPQPTGTPSSAQPLRPAQDNNFATRHLPGTPAGEVKGMLPGMAFIGMYMLLLAMLNAFAALHGIYGNGLPRYGLFGI